MGATINYYEHHLGDYMRDTAHLSMLEDAAYRRLLDAYYIKERPLPADERECFKLARAQSKAERDAVAYVLREFFTLHDEGHRQERADREIARFQDKQEKAKRSANARWDKAKTHSERNANASPDGMRTDMRTHSEGNALQSPVTSNHKETPLPPLRGESEKPSRRKPRAKLPDDFAPDDAGRKRATDAGLDVDAELEKFRDHHVGQGNLAADWQATWRTWVSRAVEFGRGKATRAKAVEKHPQWALDAGFPTVWEAENALCFERNAHEFRDGKRIEVTA